MTHDHTDHDLTDDDEEYVEHEQELIAYERLHNEEEIPDGYSTATVLLDARPSSPLKWDEALKNTEKLTHRGIRPLFDFDVKLARPFSHSGQFQAISFALSHFRDSVWPKYKAVSDGVILYRSSLAFDKTFFWGPQEINALAERNLGADEQLFFCRDVLVDYLNLLASHLPDDCPAFILFDCQEVKEPWLFALLITQDRFPRFRLGLRHAPFAIDAASWQDPTSTGDYIGRAYAKKISTPAIVGILLPPSNQIEKIKREQLKEVIDSLLEKKTPFKIISEEFLTIEWGGLDTIILCHDTPSIPLQRALDGFRAAGGEVLDWSIDKKTNT